MCEEQQTYFFPQNRMMRARLLRLHSGCESLAFSPHTRNNDDPCLAMGLTDGGIALFTQAALQDNSEDVCHTLKGHRHQYSVTSVAFNSSGRLLASGSSDTTVRLWDTHTRECVAALEGHTKPVKSVAFSPDSCLLASASADRTVRLWDVVERQAASPVHVLEGHTASSSNDKTVRLWDVVYLKAVHVLEGHTACVTSVSFSLDGQQLASGSVDCTVRLWSVTEGVPGPVLQHDEVVRCVAFYHSNRLASGSDDGYVRLWDVGILDHPKLLRKVFCHVGPINSMAFSSDGCHFVSGSNIRKKSVRSNDQGCDKNVRLWSVASSEMIAMIGQSDIVSCVDGRFDDITCVAFHPNVQQFASCSEDKTMLWTRGQ
jgi:WD40 repeat protein